MKAFILATFVAFLVGCGNNMDDDGLNKGQKQAADRIDVIAKASGGDWDKVSATDRDYLVNTVSAGSEQSAKMLLLGKAGKLKATPGGPKK